MTVSSFRPRTVAHDRAKPFRRYAHTLWVASLMAAALVCLATMEQRFDGLAVSHVQVAETPVTVYRPDNTAVGPPVVVAHGFAGSRQMMDQIAVTLARQGFVVGSVDLPGQGRNPVPMSADINRIDGTTAQLVSTVDEVARYLTGRADTQGPVSFVGHSMATDVVIRAAQAGQSTGAVVAISMYSPAVTETSPAALLVISGAREGHLRAAGLSAVQQISASAAENETVTADDVVRRTAVASWVGHVGVLYAERTLAETADWIRQTVDAGHDAPLDRSGAIAGAFLLILVVLLRALCRWIPAQPTAQADPIPTKRFVACLLVPIPVVLAVAALPTFGLAGFAAFGTLTAILGLWGLTQLLVLGRRPVRFSPADVTGVAIYLGLALIFALALDRYGAAFWPTGPRGIVLAGLLVGTIPVMLADSALVHHASWLRRSLVRLALLAGLAGTMALAPTTLGLTFTVLPVLVLFFLVYGSVARGVAARRGPAGVALGQGIVLAWAIAASTPLFATAGAL